jgi:F0F1-type ATP synthase membrane subunit a
VGDEGVSQFPKKFPVLIVELNLFVFKSNRLCSVVPAKVVDGATLKSPALAEFLMKFFLTISTFLYKL